MRNFHGSAIEAMMDLLNAVLLSIIEGATEFLPISSTGHLIIAQEYLGFGQGAGQEFANAFLVLIQVPAILAVVLYFWRDLWPFVHDAARRTAICALWMRIMVAFFPAAVLGALLDKPIEKLLFHSVPVAVALIVGGVLLIAIERWNHRERLAHVSAIGYRTAFLIGCFQCIAMIPGTSRSAATIIGAMLLGASRAAAAEFSFFLAVPTLSAAAGYKLLKGGFAFSAHQWLLLGVGAVGSFLVAYASVAFLMAYIRTHSFALFGYYRIALGLLVLWLLR